MEYAAVAVMVLKRAGWSVGEIAFTDESGGLVWVVSGHNGENLIHAAGATRDEAWRRALEQAGEVGMLARGAGDGPSSAPS
jgi:hypothetical protein